MARVQQHSARLPSMPPRYATPCLSHTYSSSLTHIPPPFSRIFLLSDTLWLQVGKGRHVALVFFVGGVTSSEVSLLRLLARQNKADGLVRECIIGSTKLLSGDQLLASFHEPFSPNQPPQHAAKDRDSSGHTATASTSASSSARQTSDVRSVRST